MYVAMVQINHNLSTHQPEIICVIHAKYIAIHTQNHAMQVHMQSTMQCCHIS